MSGEGLLRGRPLVEAPLQFRLQSGGPKSRQQALLLCAKCDAPAFIRKSERVTATVKHLVAHCTNSGCGHIFKVEVVATATLNPGLLPAHPDMPVTPANEVPHILPPRGSPEDDEDQMSMFDAA